MSLPIPESHLDLLTRPLHGVLTAMMADGQPHSSLVWCDYDGLCARVNTTRQREKGRNMLANPKVCLLVVDPQNTARYLEIRGEQKMSPTLITSLFGSILRVGRTSTPPMATPNGIAELQPVELNGYPQWLLIRGQDVSRPLLLYLHGGPGESNMWGSAYPILLSVR